MADKTLTESAVRSRVTRAGYALHKCRSRNPQVPDYGTYMLADIATNAVVLSSGHSDYGMTLDDVTEFLS